MEFKNYGNMQLLKAYDSILSELRDRGLVRSSNAPTGDYAEYLVCCALGLTHQTNSTAGYDALDNDGIRYQIKARKNTPHNKSRQLGAIRNLDAKNFDFLIGIIFNADFTVYKAIKIPHSLIVSNHRFSKHTNSALFFLEDKVWSLEGIEDLTKQIAAAQI